MSEMYLSDNEIVEAIKGYIDDKIYNYAVLIDGEWGSGKTYFIKEKLVNELSLNENTKSHENEDYKAKKIIYLSLYGVKTTEEISNGLYINIIDKFSKNSNKIISKANLILGAGVKVLGDFLKTKGVDLTNLEDTIGKIVELKNCILILDDLERCDCNINEVLGYINNFVEHDGIKVILVANEKEIGKVSRHNNLELKYMVASNNKIELKDESDIDKAFKKNNYSEDKDKKVSIEDINKNLDKLFGENDLYKSIKEKLIGLTIKYYPNLEEKMRLLIDKNIKDTNLKIVLYDFLPDFIEYAKGKSHINLRTFQFFLSKINKLNILVKESISEEHDYIIKNIIEYCYRICVLYKKGIYKNVWEKGNLYGNIKTSPELLYGGYTLGFKFVDDYIVSSKLNEEEVIKTIKSYIEYSIETKVKDDPLELYGTWWEMSENKVRISIQEILKLLRDGKYPTNKFCKIILYLSNLVVIGFETIFIDEAIEIMISQIGARKDYSKLDEGFLHIHDKDVLSEYNKNINRIKDFIKENGAKNKVSEINKCLDSLDNWGACLHDYIKNNREVEGIKRCYISELDIDKVKFDIINSDSHNISMFRYAISLVYNFSNIDEYYANDAINIKLIIDFLNEESDDNFDLIKKLNIKELKILLEDKYKKLIKETL